MGFWRTLIAALCCEAGLAAASFAVSEAGVQPPAVVSASVTRPAALALAAAGASGVTAAQATAAAGASGVAAAQATAAAGASGVAAAQATAASEAQGSLAAARVLLNNGKVAAAAAAYKGILPGDRDWPERLTDMIRWQLIEQHPLEAWRLTEVAYRTGAALPQLGYYRLLSEVKARICTLGLDSGPAAWGKLLRASIYRFHARFQQGDYRADPYASAEHGPLQLHLSNSQTHYLVQIPQATLIPGTGCAPYKDRLEDRDTALAFEFAELKHWYEHDAAASGHASTLQGEEPVELRLLELAARQKDAALEQRLLARFQRADLNAWLRLPDPERRFIWQRLVAAGLFKAPPYKPEDALYPLVRSLSLELKTPEVAAWLGLLDWPSLTSGDMERLVDHALSVEGMPEQPFLLATRAKAYYSHNDMPAALAVVRRLLLLEEAAGNSEVEGAASALGAQIFAEYTYDDAMLGALQNALPAATWGKIFRRQLILLALTGNAAGYEQLAKATAQPSQARSLQLTTAELSCLSALAHRRGHEFTRSLEAGQHGGRGSGGFFADLGAAVLQLNAQERQAVAPFLNEVARLLRRQLGDAGGQKRTLELIRLFAADATDRYGKGSESVRQGTVRAGVADLRAATILPSPFVWNPPQSLALRDLLVQPLDATQRDWVIK